MKNYNRLLEGKRVFVTTGARGIGKEIALLFANQGATVAVGGKNIPCLNKTIEELQKITPASRGFMLVQKQFVEGLASGAVKG